MSTTPTPLFDMSKSQPIGEEETQAPTQGQPTTQPVALGVGDSIKFHLSDAEGRAQILRQSMSYGAQQNPDAYAKLITLHKETGVPPQVAQGNEAEVEHAAKVNSIDYPAMAVSHPRTTSWVSNPDNAAVSHDDIGTLTNIESRAASIGATPSFLERNLANYNNEPFSIIPGLKGVKALVKTITDTPEVRNLPINYGKTLGQTFDDAKFLFEGVNKPLDTPILQPVSSGIDYLANNRPEVTKGVIPDAVWNLIAGVSKGEARTAAGLSTPKNLAILGGTGGLSLAQKALLDVYFASEMVPGILQTPKRIMDAPNAQEGIAAGVEGLINAYFTKGVVSGIGSHTPFVEDLAHIITSGELSKLKQRSPEKFHEALTEIFDGHDSLQIPVEQFDTYFQSKNINPAEVAQQIGAKNYLEAKVSGGHVEVAPQDFIGKLDSEHQKGLLGDVVNPDTGMTHNQKQEGEQELQKFIADGGIEKLRDTVTKADAETQASPEYQDVKTQLRQQYVDAGETPEVADNYATLQANVYANLARETGMKPAELMGLYRPVVKLGEAPEASLNQGERGWFRALPDGSFEIGKTKIGDLSTFVHEPAHSYLFLLNELSKREGASENLKGDYAKILDFLGAKDGEALTTEQHEKWARANEQYLREGKAPSEGLKGVFQRFSVWLSSIYKRASDLGVELSDDIRGVMDRLYASEDGVNRAAKESGPRLFNSPEEAGWTPEQFKTYAESRGIEAEQAKAEIHAKLNEAVVREQTDAWREEEQTVKEAVTTEIDQKPEYKAIRQLRKGVMDDGSEIKLNRDELVKQFGEEKVKQLQKQHPGMFRNEGGVDAEVVAEALGFDSAGKMMDVLENTPRRKEAIDTATRAYMTAKHGDIRYDGTLDDQARIALENDKKSANLHKELKALQKQVGEMQAEAKDKTTAAKAITVPPIEAFRKAAQEMVANKSAIDMQPTRYLDASRKASRESFEALANEDYQKASDAKVKELINHFLFREASKAKENIDKYQAYGQKMGTTKELSKLGLAGQPFLEQIRGFLDRYNFRKVTDKSIRERQETLAQFLTRMKDDENTEIPIDPMLLDESRQRNYREVPYSELTAVYDAMRAIQKAAYRVNSTAAEGKRVALDTAAGELMDKLFASLGEPKIRNASDEARTFLERFSDVTPDIAAILPEFTFERWDGMKKQGPWHEYFWDRYNDAVDHKNRLLEKIWPQIEQSRDAEIDRSKKFYIKSMDVTLAKDDILSIAHNAGNESNLDKQMRGGLQFGNDQAPRPINAESLMEILSHLTKEEIDLVNSNWKALETLKPDAAELARKRTGTEPKWIEPKPLQVKNGTLEGGYWPVHFDPRFSAAGEKQIDTSLSVDKMFTQYASASTNQGYLVERTGYVAPLSLDWQQTMGRNINDVVTDISHWEFASDAQRLLKHPQTKTAIISRMGEMYYKNLLGWVKNTVKQGTIGAEASNTLEGFRRNMRSKVSTAVLGFRVMNAVVETGITPILALQHVGPMSSLEGVTTYLRNPAAATKFATEASDYIKHIDTGIDRNVSEAIDQLKGDHSLLGDIRRWSIASRVAIWKIGAVMAWHAGYHDAMTQGLEGKAAVRVADSIYRMTQESGRQGDLSAAQRDPRFNELTMFIGPSLIQYNNLRRSVMAFKDQGLTANTAGLGVTTLLAGLAANTILFDALRGKAPDDKKKIPAWMAARMLFGIADGVPIANQISKYGETKLMGEHGGEPKLIPVLQVGKDTVDALNKTNSAFQGHGKWAPAIKADMKSVGSWTGLPMVQGSITGQYIYDVLSGEYKPAHPWSPVTDAFYARPPKK